MTETYELIVKDYLEDALATFRSYKRLADRALDQVGDEEFFLADGDEANSIAIIVKHIAGNQRSRWTDFLTEDGEKPDRNRDSEFEAEGEDRPAMIENWESGWGILFATLESLTPEDLKRKVSIRGEAHSVVQAINRQLTHYAYHIGQIVHLAKVFRGEEWKSLSVPRNRSAEFNEYLARKVLEGKPVSHPLEGSAEFVRSGGDDD